MPSAGLNPPADKSWLNFCLFDPFFLLRNNYYAPSYTSTAPKFKTLTLILSLNTEIRMGFCKKHVTVFFFPWSSDRLSSAKNLSDFFYNSWSQKQCFRKELLTLKLMKIVEQNQGAEANLSSPNGFFTSGAPHGGITNDRIG